MPVFSAPARCSICLFPYLRVLDKPRTWRCRRCASIFIKHPRGMKVIPRPWPKSD